VDARRKRLLYQSCHRGMQETDILLGGFVRSHLDDLDDGQLGQLEALMQESDTDLFNWISGREAVPTAFDTDLMSLIKTFNK